MMSVILRMPYLFATLAAFASVTSFAAVKPRTAIAAPAPAPTPTPSPTPTCSPRRFENVVVIVDRDAPTVGALRREVTVLAPLPLAPDFRAVHFAVEFTHLPSPVLPAGTILRGRIAAGCTPDVTGDDGVALTTGNFSPTALPGDEDLMTPLAIRWDRYGSFCVEMDCPAKSLRIYDTGRCAIIDDQGRSQSTALESSEISELIRRIGALSEAPLAQGPLPKNYAGDFEIEGVLGETTPFTLLATAKDAGTRAFRNAPDAIDFCRILEKKFEIERCPLFMSVPGASPTR